MIWLQMVGGVLFTLSLVIIIRIYLGRKKIRREDGTTTPGNKELLKWLKDHPEVGKILSLGAAFGLTLWIVYLLFNDSPNDLWVHLISSNLILELIIIMVVLGLVFGLSSFNRVIGLILIILIFCAILRIAKQFGYKPPNPSATASRVSLAKPAVFRPALKPVYDCQRPERFTITAPFGDPYDRSGWNNQIVLPNHCHGEISPRDEVYIVDENGNLYENGPPSMGYRHWEVSSGVRHLWYHAKKQDKGPVVVDISFSPSRH